MKKIMLLICMSVALSVSIMNVSANEKPINQQFDELQERITESLQDNGSHYVYDKEKISSWINQLDVKALNDFYGTNYTLDSLKTKIFNSIDSINLQENKEAGIIGARGTYCGRNYKTKGWNYERWFTNYNNTNVWANALDRDSSGGAVVSGALSILGAIPGFQGVGIAGTLLGLNATWRGFFKSALMANNGVCGVVSDINIFTSIYTVRSQSNFYE